MLAFSTLTIEANPATWVDEIPCFLSPGPWSIRRFSIEISSHRFTVLFFSMMLQPILYSRYIYWNFNWSQRYVPIYENMTQISNNKLQHFEILYRLITYCSVVDSLGLLYCSIFVLSYMLLNCTSHYIHHIGLSHVNQYNVYHLLIQIDIEIWIHTSKSFLSNIYIHIPMYLWIKPTLMQKHPSHIP